MTKLVRVFLWDLGALSILLDCNVFNCCSLREIFLKFEVVVFFWWLRLLKTSHIIYILITYYYIKIWAVTHFPFGSWKSVTFSIFVQMTLIHDIDASFFTLALNWVVFLQ